MKFTNCSPFQDVLLIEPKVFGDARGFFMEVFQAELFTQAGVPSQFVQDNHSGSRQGILRGLHYQVKQTQGKLVRVVAGEVYDVVVDLRRYSPTFGRWAGTYLSAENKLQFWVPPGFAHGFLVTSPWAEVVYKVTEYYAPQHERTLLWNDPQLKIEWPLEAGQEPLLSDKDRQGFLFDDAPVFDTPTFQVGG